MKRIKNKTHRNKAQETWKIIFTGEINMKFLLIFGDAAVGKMTVGQELAKITELRLFHNHITIDPVRDIFGDPRRWDIIERLRTVIFEEFAATDNYGLIFTFMWIFDSSYDWERVERMTGIFKRYNADIYYVELHAPLDIRLQRCVSENRLNHKPSWRDKEKSYNYLKNHGFRCVSNDGEIPFDNYIKIDNSNISPEIAAKIIREKFSL
jgi:hypothetical protein